MKLSKATIQLCQHMLTTVSLSASAPDFDAVAVNVINAKKELAAALNELNGATDSAEAPGPPAGP